MTLPFRFAPFLLDPATRELRENGELVALPARAFDCLAYLIEHRNRAVGRDELIAAVWGRVEVSDALLSHTIVKIRRSLGDTGNEQRTIRTVPRFGYRWVGPVDSAPAETETGDATVVPVAASEGTEQHVDTSMPSAASPSTPKPRAWLWSVAAVLLIAASIAFVLMRTASRREIATNPVAQTKGVPDVIAMPALVLPAQVNAPEDWRWLRFGLMDLVSTRLRDGALLTMPSENVVGLLKQRESHDDDVLHDPALAKVATLRVQPHIRLDQNRWNVRLDAFGSQRSLSAEATADDAIKAGRDATDELLRKLGHAPDLAKGAASSPALDELLQRSGAAMLADQLEEARSLISAAPPELQQQPRVEQRMAQIELRAGDYAAVETRLHALLDRLAPARDGALRARVLMTLAAAYVRQGQEGKAAEMYEEAIALRKDAGDHEVLGVAYLGRGVVFAQQGRYDEATAELSRARIELETVGDGLGVAGVDVNLGDFQLLRHRPADALPILRNAARAFEQLGAREGLAHALAQQASAEREMLEFDAALATTQRLWPPEAHTNNVRMRWALTCERAATLVAASRFDEARGLIEQVRRDSDPRKDRSSRALVDGLDANIAWLRGDATSAAGFAAAALVPELRDADPAAYARILLLRARALRQDGHLEDAGANVRQLRANADGDEWQGMLATLGEAEQTRALKQREPALEKFAQAMPMAEHYNVPEDLVAVASSYLDALIEASQLDTARSVAGRIAAWADRDPRAATAQAHLYRALGQDDAARKAEEAVARMNGRSVSSAPSGRP